jgi:hypothetical protein
MITTNQRIFVFVSDGISYAIMSCTGGSTVIEGCSGEPTSTDKSCIAGSCIAGSIASSSMGRSSIAAHASSTPGSCSYSSISRASTRSDSDIPSSSRALSRLSSDLRNSNMYSLTVASAPSGCQRRNMRNFPSAFTRHSVASSQSAKTKPSRTRVLIRWYGGICKQLVCFGGAFFQAVCTVVRVCFVETICEYFVDGFGYTLVRHGCVRLSYDR